MVKYLKSGVRFRVKLLSSASFIAKARASRNNVHFLRGFFHAW